MLVDAKAIFKVACHIDSGEARDAYRVGFRTFLHRLGLITTSVDLFTTTPSPAEIHLSFHRNHAASSARRASSAASVRMPFGRNVIAMRPARPS